MKIIRSIGLDLSLVGTGVVILENGKIVAQELIKSKPVGDKPIDELERIRKIVRQINDSVSRNGPYADEVGLIAVIEGLAFMAKGTSLVQLSALNYMTRAMLAEHYIPFVIVAPTSLKKFVTGNGASKKDVMLIETYKRWGVTILDDNVNDAYGLAQIGLALLGGNSKATNKLQGEVLSLLKKQL
jgi:Holliday junction resolvasome RuvABC endonuclease subunit